MERSIKSEKIVLKNVTHRYLSTNGSPTTALQGMSLEVGNTEIVGIVGPSGCGKTTILDLIAGFMDPYDGDVLIDGEPIRSRRRKSGMVFQTDATFPWLTVAENIGYALEVPREATEARELVNHYVELLGLTGFAERYPRELSGGMRKRVELGRAYASGSEILLLDEPFGSLDVFTKQEMQVLLNGIWEKDKKTIVYVTHDVEEAIFVSHRVLVLTHRPGRVKEVFSVPFGRPRLDSLKLEIPFLQLRKTIVDCLDEKKDQTPISKNEN